MCTGPRLECKGCVCCAGAFGSAIALLMLKQIKRFRFQKNKRGVTPKMKVAEFEMRHLWFRAPTNWETSPMVAYHCSCMQNLKPCVSILFNTLMKVYQHMQRMCIYMNLYIWTYIYHYCYYDYYYDYDDFEWLWLCFFSTTITSITII